MTTAYRTCPLCEAVCGLTITLDPDQRVTDVRGDREDPFSKGFICPKGASLGRLDEDPDRLSTPRIRKDGEFAEVSWEEAFATVEVGLTKAIAEHGRGSLGIYLGNPSVHTLAGTLYGGPLIKSLGTRQVFSASTADQMPKHVACGLMYGSAGAIPVPDLDRTQYLLMLGANPLESNGSLCTAPDFPGRLKAIKKRGGKVTVVDPRRTRTADLANEHVFIRPGTDAYLLFGIVHTLFAEGLAKPAIDVDGLDELRLMAADFPPHVVAGATGVPQETVVRLAREVAAADRAAVYARMGTCTQAYGTLAQWLVDVINVLTGNLDREGGAMFARPAHGMALGEGARKPYRTGRWHSRVRGLPEANGELPVATLADEIETPGTGQIRAMITVAGNPVLSAPNGTRVGQALETLDFMVSVDPYINETTRHAHVILPPPRLLQSGHYDFALLGVAVRNYARYSPPVLPLGDRPSETDILARLTMIAAGQGGDPGMVDELVLDTMFGWAGLDTATHKPQLIGVNGAERRLDAMLRMGPYGAWVVPGGITLQTLLDNPHGIDLGPLEPRLGEVLRLDRVQLAPPHFVADVVRLRDGLAAPPNGFVLIGRRHLRSNNSWMHNVEPLVGGTNRCTLQINPGDVDRLGLAGEAVVTSAAGSLTVTLEPTDTIMPGVVSLPHGWGHSGVPQAVAGRNAGVNANALTDERVVDPLSGNAVFNGVPVEIGHIA